ncbi:hypothetical protein CKQ84_14165 [Shewanella sp. WE21]|uniref:hypothetical protein n=1 Tax=Shewanella TaxID=22 RepID=UPI000CF7347C|nr:hypothetical protein [Shewanella sp. WE21]AVI66933.1 hypothetical protein CKQ84_14165 [Shewanella sp. WE21]
MATKPKINTVDYEWRAYPNSAGHSGAVQNQSSDGVLLYVYVTKAGEIPPEDEGVIIDTAMRTLPIQIGASEVMHVRSIEGDGTVRLV